MNKNFIFGVIGFVAGAITGALVTKKVLDDKYLDDKYEYAAKRSLKAYKEGFEDASNPEQLDAKVKEYEEKVKDYGYECPTTIEIEKEESQVSDFDKYPHAWEEDDTTEDYNEYFIDEEWEHFEIPYVVEEWEHFETKPAYDHISVIFNPDDGNFYFDDYGDRERWKLFVEGEEYIGVKNVQRLLTDPDCTEVFVRNESEASDYEVVLPAGYEK